MNYDNRGGIWKNTRADKPTSPKYTGSAVIDGVDYYVSAWPGDNENPKSPVLKFSFSKKQDTKPSAGNGRGQHDMGDDLSDAPF